MTGVDWIIVGVVVLMVLLGVSQGFLAGALSLAGFALGAFIGTRLAPLLLPGGAESPYAPVFGLAGALLAGMGLATGFEGLGSVLRRGLRPTPGLTAVDGVLGGVLMGCLGLALAWVAGAVALQTPGARGLRRDVQRSVILARLNEVLPSRRLLNALARFDPFPQVGRVDIDVDAPSPRIAHDPQVRAAAASVVKVLGSACGLGVEGSGWVAAPGVVVTNAHVVAGQTDTSVHPGGGDDGLPARVVHFDPRHDVAVLRVRGLHAPSLPLAAHAPRGRAAAILGYPLDGPYRVRAARLGQTRQVFSQDAYGQGSVRRTVTGLRGLVQSGNSGGPVVDGRGRVVATVFAATVGRRPAPHGGYGVPNATVRAALRDDRGAASTGACAR